MILPKPLDETLKDFFRNTPKNINVVTGGCINQAARFSIGDNSYFVKWSSELEAQQMFSSEQEGLALLRSTEKAAIPQLIASGSIQGLFYMVLDWIDAAQESPRFWKEFGRRLAGLHQIRAPKFGLSTGNYIGSLHQQNKLHTKWSDFFIEERILPQLTLARENFSSIEHDSFNSLFKELESIMPNSQPSLLHGDLWRGNFIVGHDYQSWLIDPAVYYGHPEMELAFTKLFGGFHSTFYESYESVNQLEKGFSSRVDIYNLYPLLVHLNLFGRSYLSQIRRIIQQF